MRDAAIDLLERDEQLRRLEDAFALACGGRGRIIAIAAEAGAGKTALTEQFVANHAQIARMYWGACENLSTPEVLLPLRDIARASGESFNLGADQITVFESVLELLSRRTKPAVLVIEDVHWADTATLDLIRFLGRRIARVRALILITYRNEDLDVVSAVRTLLGELPAGSVDRMSLELGDVQRERTAVANRLGRVRHRGQLRIFGEGSADGGDAAILGGLSAAAGLDLGIGVDRLRQRRGRRLLAGLPRGGQTDDLIGGRLLGKALGLEPGNE